MKIRTLLIEDDPEWIDGIKLTIEQSRDIVLIGVLSGNEIELQMIKCLEVEVIVINMNADNDMEVLKAIDSIIDINENIKIIVLSSVEEDRIIWDAYLHGAVNYVVKSAVCSRAITKLIREAHANTLGIHHTSAQAIRREFQRQRKELWSKLLTPQERKILCYVYQGKTTSEIHRILNIEEKTIDNHVTSINRKLQVKNRREAAQVANKKGLLLFDEIRSEFYSAFNILGLIPLNFI
ncbi:DNA-binding response regulator [Paenibacillus glucanolyticus]|jgi:DNA-binding NarL/FixJ family response regulator|uniref:response regulator transcription factor n=1 Tax=Paenibacillus TaxID=44249 RepID=UPI0003E232F8|nr:MULTISPECIES: response regulator transcription factor [Paenibacillus]ANA79509.1 hypothetical protein A3958_05700 [Paenibacillus glucanolyticus]AVV56542.1 DNA-binding response regulator [Paenibacillus glucanolyticus]ETT31179.1 two-component response regulator [Paenibacillus sp. FSL R5-808]OMF77100.1 hypothetical protein BK142_13430 [Paenibacillus glucanolyticus]